MKWQLKNTTILASLLMTGCASPMYDVLNIKQKDYSASLDCKGYLSTTKEYKYFNSINVRENELIVLKENRVRDNAYRYSEFGIEDLTDIECNSPTDYLTIEYVLKNKATLLASEDFFIDF